MTNRRHLKYVCYTGAMMAVFAIPLFKGLQPLGSIITITGLAIVITMKVILWRTRVKTA
ncbi:hypothetical protein [Roseivirga sp. 4D4]|uniref:hypothetical protein n=1 Tax=Roseivirga sp. 4D4 TaxID=1889784 RepID=UPI00147A63BC|nr:hypothetical protein [Roseivirga sp. 4D4]